MRLIAAKPSGPERDANPFDALDDDALANTIRNLFTTANAGGAAARLESRITRHALGYAKGRSARVSEV